VLVNPLQLGCIPVCHLSGRNHRCGGHLCAPCSTRIISTASAPKR
jgi:hypothetical protein